MVESVLRKKSYAFALKVIKVYKQIVAEKKEYVLSKQFLVCLRTSSDIVGELRFFCIPKLYFHFLLCTFAKKDLKA